MARARVTISLTPHELAIVQQAMRIFSEVIYNDLTGVEGTVQFDGTLCNDNWSLMYQWSEEIRATIGDGEPPPRVQPAAPAQIASGQGRSKRKGRGTVAQGKSVYRKAKRWGRLFG